MGTDVSLTPSEAYAIDKKIDDGFPQRGNVLAMMPNLTSHSPWAAGGNSDPLFGMTVGGDCDPGSCGPVELGDGVATLPSDATCYDNAGKEGQRERYSVGWKDGSLTTCALSFRFQ
jgi:hypothetical protein